MSRYVDNANSDTYDGFDFLTNVMVGYTYKTLDVVFDVYNVFDQRYAMEVTKDSTGNSAYKPGAPRTWMARVSYKF
ncbi:MAG: hypothetical protein SFH39_08150 [Candidatus Magnetobacterium sp. LHC-1]|nr:TonB-dependent receptor [Nitrospirota bacterium]